MPIDHKEWQSLSERLGTPQATQVEYRTISQDAAWEQLKTWLRAEIEAKDEELANNVTRLQLSGDYSHQGLVTQKLLVDFTQAQLVILRQIEHKVLAYTKESAGV